MTKTPVEIELDDFWHGTGRYEEFGYSDEHGESATRIFLDHYIVIPRSDLPKVNASDQNGFVTALAQETYQPNLYLHPSDGDIPGAWSRDIAYANLAIAEAVEARDAEAAEATAARDKRRDELAQEFTAVNSYGGQLPYTQNLINRIIELEGATK